MAQNGGRGLSITGAPAQPTRSGLLPHGSSMNFHRDLFNLSQSYPGNVRVQNDYVDVPVKKVAAKNKDDDSNQTHYLVRLPERPRTSRLEPTANVTSVHKHVFTSQPAPITSQPHACVKSDNKTEQNIEACHVESIICQHCGGCKCESCCKPKKLPSTWILNKKCHCSADEAVECCSCLCCVKGLFYHISKDYEMDNDVECSDNPCSCSPYKRCLRWSSLGLMSLFLPCLCLYWPLHGCVKVLDHCYSRYPSEGCHCASRKTLLTREMKSEKT